MSHYAIHKSITAFSGNVVTGALVKYVEETDKSLDVEVAAAIDFLQQDSAAMSACTTTGLVVRKVLGTERSVLLREGMIT